MRFTKSQDAKIICFIKKYSSRIFGKYVSKTLYFLIYFLAVFTQISCDQNTLVSSQATTTDRAIASEKISEARNKFPLPYYLVPAEDAKFIFANSLDPRVADQLVFRISGKKHYKLFVHPESEAFYDFFRRSYNYIGPDLTEFFASPLSNGQLFIVWNKNNSERKPFIIKVRLDKNSTEDFDGLVHESKLDRSIANQKNLDQIDGKKLDSATLKISPVAAGLSVDKSSPGDPQKSGNQLIFEISD